MSFTIKREIKAITTMVRSTGEEVVVPEQLPSTVAPFVGLGVGGWVKFKDLFRSSVMKEFDHSCKLGKIVAIHNAEHVHVRELDGHEHTGIYPHHMAPATPYEVVSGSYKAGDKVVVVDGSKMKDVTLGSRCGREWDAGHAALVGQLCTIESICSDCDLYLKGHGRYISPEYVRKATSSEIAAVADCKAGDSVVLLDGRKITAKRGSLEARIWTSRLTSLIGLVAKIYSVDRDGDLWLVERSVGAVSPDFVRKATPAEVEASKKFVKGDRVIVLDGERVMTAHRAAGIPGSLRGTMTGCEWNADKRAAVGKSFVVSRGWDDGDVSFLDEFASFISADYLRHVTANERAGLGAFSVGDYVVCDTTHEECNRDPGWVSDMNKTVGGVGRITDSVSTGFQVSYESIGKYIYKPEWLRRVAPRDDETIALLNSTLAAFNGSSVEKKTAAIVALTSALGKRKADD